MMPNVNEQLLQQGEWLEHHFNRILIWFFPTKFTKGTRYEGEIRLSGVSSATD